MNRILWKLLMWSWCRRARKLYGGPGENGELFNTACFQAVVKTTVGTHIAHPVIEWLTQAGYIQGPGGAHWFPNKKLADAMAFRCGK